MKTNYMAAVLIAAVMVFSSCYDEGDPHNSSYDSSSSIIGTVMDFESSEELANVEVSTLPPTSNVVTSSDGSFIITENVDRDTIYQIKFKKNSYVSKTTIISLDSGEINVGEVLLERNYTHPIWSSSTVWIIGTVKNSADESLIKDAEVKISYNDTSVTAVTDNAGVFQTQFTVEDTDAETIEVLTVITVDGETVLLNPETFSFDQTNIVTYEVTF